MRRFVVSLLVILGMLALTERRLSDGVSHATSDPIPPLWEEARHPLVEAGVDAVDADPAAAADHCAFVTSMDLGDRYTFTSPDAGVRFDMDADGDLEQVSWTEAGSNVAFVAIDRNDDGQITSGKELAGNYALAGVTNGPDALHALAGREPRSGERRAALDIEDELFQRLVLWTDANHNGISDAGELRPIRDLVSDIGLAFTKHHRKDRHGNESRYRGFVHVRSAPGVNAARSAEEDLRRRRPLHHVCLVTREP
jgi:hypothetical protein